MSINDELIWQSLNNAFCSFKSKVATHNFCRHEMNVTGLCNKSACPLANGSYATIREEAGKCYLYIKTIERAHMPARLWQKEALPRNYEAALQVVSERLEHYPKFLVHRNKQRLTRIHQYLTRMRKLAKRETSKTVVPERIKVERREARREQKALAAAKLTSSIQAELLQRLKQGTYGEIYNFHENAYAAALNDAQEEGLEEAALQAEEDDDRLVQFVEANLDEDDDIEDAVDKQPSAKRPAEETPKPTKPKPTAKKKKRRVEIEYDDEDDLRQPDLLLAAAEKLRAS